MSLRGTLQGSSANSIITLSPQSKSAPDHDRHYRGDSFARDSATLKLLRRLTNNDGDAWEGDDDDDDFVVAATNVDQDSANEEISNESTTKNNNNNNMDAAATEEEARMNDAAKVDETNESDNTNDDDDDEVAFLDMTNSTSDNTMDQDSIEVEVDTTQTGNDSLGINNDDDDDDDDMEEETTTPAAVEHDTQSSMLDLSAFTQATTICQDDPTYLHFDSHKSCAEIVVGDNGSKSKKKKKKSIEEVCESDSGLKDDDGKMIKIGHVCKRSCGVCDDEQEEVVLLDEKDNEGGEVEVIEEEIELIKETLDELTSNDDDDNGMIDEETEEFVEELEEELKLDEMEVEELMKNNDGEKEEEADDDDIEVEVNEGAVEGGGKGDGKSAEEKSAGSETESTENEALVIEGADEDDAYIPEEKEDVKEDENEETEIEKGAKDDSEDTTDKDLASDQEKKEDDVNTADEVIEDDSTATLTDEDEAKLDSDADEKEAEEKVESELESSLEDTDGEDVSEKLDKEAEEASEEDIDGEEQVEDEGSDSGTKDAAEDDEEAIDATSSEGEEGEVAPESKDDSGICKDDPDFEYKGYDGFNCQYIKENKPQKCEKKHGGVKVGLVSCPVSCDMVDECMALHEQESDSEVNASEEEAADEEEVIETETDVDESTTEQKDDLELEEEMESELETALEQGTVDLDTAEKLDEEMLEAIEEGVGGEFEKELEEELGLAGGDDKQEDLVEVQSNTTAIANTTDHLTTIELSFDEDASTIEVDGPLVVANLTISEDDLSFCKDDPDFKFKGYEGFNCQYIKENKPEKCNKVHNGEKVGVVSCPVSCDMVDECVALQESKVDAALESALTNEENDNDAIDMAAEQNINEESEDSLEEEGSAKITDQVDANEVLENEEDEATLTEENQVDDADTQAESAALEEEEEEEEAVEAKADTDVKDEDSDKQHEVSSDEEVDETNITSDLCQDDPDFKFKGYDGFNCEYIKENKPAKCNKVHNGEKVGVVSCPVSCGMVEECMALQTQKDSADDAEIAEENEMVDENTDESAVEEINDSSVKASTNDEAVNTTETKDEEVVEEQNDEDEITKDGSAKDVSTEDVSEHIDEETAKDDDNAKDASTEDVSAVDDTADDGAEDQTIVTTKACQDDPDFKFKGYDGFDCQYIKENKPAKCNKLHSGEKVGVVSCPVSCGMVDECMARQEALATEADVDVSDEVTGDETSSNNLDEVEVDTEATPQEDDEEIESKVEIGINDEELEEELEAKLEEALEEGELNEEEAEELEYEMEEALEEGLGEVFEAELEIELRCKDDPEFLYLDGDLERDCLWIRQNERCEHVHEDTGKVIGKFFCPETCGMEEECEKVTAADNTLPSTEAEAEDTMKYEDDMFEPVPEGTKSMADELQIETEFDNAANSLNNENEGGDMSNFGNDEGNFNGGGENTYDEFKDTEDLNQWDNNMGELQESTYGESFSQPTNGAENWEGYGGSNQQDSFENNLPPIDYDENWLEEESDFPFGFLILIFLGVGFFIFRKSQNRSSLQDHSRGGYQRVGVGRQVDVPQDHSKRY